MFSKKKDITEQTREQSRELRRTDRDLVRDRHKLDNEEQKLMNEIRKNASQGNKKAIEILAKQLIKVRGQKEKSLNASGHIQGLASQNAMMASNVRMAHAMDSTAKTMEKMNGLIDPQAMGKVTQKFAEQHMKMEITDDLIGETLEAALAQEGDEEEEDQIVNQVLEEIGIQMKDKINGAPRVPASAMASKASHQTEDDEIERMLANLKS
ncbi:unnamed protein product [Didymodactylos carnosus]|uniref:Uncharacterized protein n=1 Tax=Didymodactylos carnosus TaxID=1234261 RepID=A0A813VBG7_9BILA|nr:unnamed protein product [Didymodactylos carnosus]CAF0835125.1 unnamed protein product [Didymodactylos carnosus]CAF3520147.1 unnamed protein product [Didymodactylos carnosus]CAF3622289.1 unnamed protein product [Didymodactylos carnosus]